MKPVPLYYNRQTHEDTFIKPLKPEIQSELEVLRAKATASGCPHCLGLMREIDGLNKYIYNHQWQIKSTSDQAFEIRKENKRLKELLDKAGLKPPKKRKAKNDGRILPAL